MQQVIFHFPFVGFPLYGFGLMLLLAFFTVIAWSKWRTPKVGLSWERFQDMAMLLLLTGIGGARVLYMIQYSDQFPDKSALGLLIGFVSIWDGGIVFYGSIFGGMLSYYFYRRFVLKRLNINGWQLADAVAPMLAIGMALGRIGCYLNGCCWGQVACAECQPMPLPPELGQFPLIPSHARKQVTLPPYQSRLPQIHGLQTTTGFTIVAPGELPPSDPRSVVAAIEPGTAAERSGLQPGDKVVEVNGRPNQMILEINGPAKVLAGAQERANIDNVTVKSIDLAKDEKALIVETADPAAFTVVQAKLTPLREQLILSPHDSLYELTRNGALGQTELALVVERKGERVPVTFTPRTVTFFPTQLYETISMVLLTLLLLAYQPFRRHDGQVIVLLMLGYAVHRFLNEAIRIEPTYRFGLTLSQWISILIFAIGVLLEVYLRYTQPKLPAAPVPLGYGSHAIPEPVKA
ncbi:prolipoprotein diacylglyceryl transferase family protein [Limnoglobus roseus]|uniref:Phosphatidylglycerol--prolipoprotein diacylglyceryl transferase n=1 Tax=Limnoglobus roseus TaxID=2598579 RepID=A0A5C1ALR6_9BACT|nr:prolipoprotein diacylglyceryl transferase family protein [Limnoglobus roseus]QEL18114.1 prolipoprotein diacylglyceryl transferase [Limnoglobus roseus]